MKRTRIPLLLLTAACWVAAPGAAAAQEPSCLPDGSGQLDMVVTGALQARVAWSEGMECQGMPRPDGTGLRLMFADREEALLVVIGVEGVGRGGTGRDFPANFTLVREGEGEFYSTLGDATCRVDILENSPADPEAPDVFRVSGEGHCPAPVPGVGRPAEILVRPFAFTGQALWPAPGEAD